MTAIRISAVLIVKNEESSIADCLESISWSDEIVVIDSGSTDSTVGIARRFTDKVFIEDQWQGYGVQRQRAQEKATGDWILMIDADEQVTPKLREEIQSVVRENNDNNVYAIPMLCYCFGRFIRHGGWYPDYHVRLYPVGKGHYGNEYVHERLHYGKNMSEVKLRGLVHHYTYRDLEHYLTKSARYAAAWAAQRQAHGQHASLLQGVLHGIWCFIRMYILRVGFLDGKQGFLLAILSAHSTFVKYADLWVRHQHTFSKHST